jgi:PhzF family phenazine biosynthesis protein
MTGLFLVYLRKKEIAESMNTKMYQVDAFTEKLFGGNPAAVCLLGCWPNEQLMQLIAGENNLAETAFIIKDNDHFNIRWFTPAVEVDLCGHATLASAHVIFNYTDFNEDEIIFYSERSGTLKVRKEGSLLTLDFPADQFHEIAAPDALIKGLGVQPIETYMGKTDYMAILSSQKEVAELSPDFSLLSQLKGRGIIVTAKGETADFVSRFFAPQSGINEDPVTGSAHTTLIPYWARTLGKTELTAVQVSRRRGDLLCKYLGDRVEISGHAVIYMIGEITV